MSTQPYTGTKLVEQILEQGQRLRNAMVKSILDTNPLDKEFETKKLDMDLDNLISSSPYLDVECVCRICQMYAREKRNSARSTMSASCCVKQSTSKAGNCNKCCADVIKSKDDYFKQISNDCDETKTLSALGNDPYKLANCLRITIHKLRLNEAGNRKASGSSLDMKYKLPTALSHTYFVEYRIPKCLLRDRTKPDSKTDSGLDSNVTRTCSKNIHKQDVHFKHTATYDIANLTRLNKANATIRFQVSCRTIKERKSIALGSANFDISSMALLPDLACSRTLSVSDDVFVCGSLTVSFELGCGRLYYGKEFIESLSSQQSEQLELEIGFPQSAKDKEEGNVKIVVGENGKVEPEKFCLEQLEKEIPVKETLTSCRESSNRDFLEKATQAVVETTHVEHSRKNLTENSTETLHQGFFRGDLTIASDNHLYNNLLLFGLLYISEAEYFEIPINSYITCQIFAQGDSVRSRTVYQSSHPTFHFYQKLPLLYNESFLECMRDKSMVIDIWERLEEGDIIIGSVRISLYQFYITYRNAVVTQNYIANNLPVITTDWWEPVSNPANGRLSGQLKVLVAIGTNVQIHNLELERAIKKLSFTLPRHNLSKPQEALPSLPTDNFVNEAIQTPNIRSTASNGLAAKVDVATQFNYNIMDSTIPQLSSGSSEEVQKQVEFCESTTNTQQRLLECLQSSLSSTQSVNSTSSDTKAFKTEIKIESAIHLPTRRKSRVKKGRRKSGSYEDVLPNTYVTFEGSGESDLKMTSICKRSTSPQWNFKCDVALPMDLLTNSQKRLIFKVWRKSDNNSMYPCLQTDVVLGFAAIDLTVLHSGLSSIQGWFNIVDFSSKCNGQIKISITPLENHTPSKLVSLDCPSASKLERLTTDNQDVGELLGQALDRKLKELEEINKRLRSRLADVTREEEEPEALDDDSVAEEFERDINTCTIEGDELISLDFNSDERRLLSPANSHHYRPVETAADKFLAEGKQRIDTLLEKLNLLANADKEKNVVEDRYVSGCSVGSSRQLEQCVDTVFDSTFIKQMKTFDCSSTPSGMFSPESVVSTISMTDSSLDTQFSVCRQAPEGEGNSTDV